MDGRMELQRHCILGRACSCELVGRGLLAHTRLGRAMHLVFIFRLDTILICDSYR